MSSKPVQTSYFVLVHGLCRILSVTDIREVIKQEDPGLLLVSDNVIHNNVLRPMTMEERSFLPLQDSVLRVISDQDHPDLKKNPGELFLCNCSDNEPDVFANIPWNSKRAGKQAYSPYGEKLPSYFFPVFVWKDQIFPGSYEPKELVLT